MSSSQRPLPKSILVIGGGPAGLATLRNLLERSNGAFEKVELVERRDRIGGVWCRDEDQDEETIATNTTLKPQWPTPSSPELTNISSVGFNGERLSGAETGEYMRKFGEEYVAKGVVRLNVEVVSVEELVTTDESKAGGWKVKLRDWSDVDEMDEIKMIEEIWDAVVVCAGFYDRPHWPKTEGLNEAKRRGLALDGRWWSPAEADAYKGKKAVIIGNRHSSSLIATELGKVTDQPVYISSSSYSSSNNAQDRSFKVHYVGRVLKYILQPPHETDQGSILERLTVIFDSGEEIKDVDLVIHATGYYPHPDFVHVRPIPQSTPSSSHLVPLTSYSSPLRPHHRRIPFLHAHILYAYNPSLAFIGHILALEPFAFANVASTWLSLAWSGQLGTDAYPDDVQSRLKTDEDRMKEVERLAVELAGEGELVTYTFFGPSSEAAYLSSLVSSSGDDLPVSREELEEKMRVVFNGSSPEAVNWARAVCV
ncbi:hypothetical protein C8R42DRAFT_337196 [Lentinula raphanica]|nr:hypothetical protein C8R42DRAFT_337196 [Lentinula raphanica]